MTRDLICEEFEQVTVEQNCNPRKGYGVTLYFQDEVSADRAYFVIKNALELGIPIQIRCKPDGWATPKD